MLLRVADWALKSFGQSKDLELIPDTVQVESPSGAVDATFEVESNPTVVPSEKSASKEQPNLNFVEESPAETSAADAAKRQKKNDDATVKVDEWNLRAIPPRLRDSTSEVRDQMFKSFDVFR